MLNKHAASKDARDHMERARIGLESAHREGLNAAEVLRNPHVQASHLKLPERRSTRPSPSSSRRGGSDLKDHPASFETVESPLQ